MSKKDEEQKQIDAYQQSFENAISVTAGGISVDRDVYKSVIGEDEYKKLADANAQQLVIDRAIALAATKVGYAHLQSNSEVDSVGCVVNQYEGRKLNGTISRSTRIPPRDGGPEGSKPGGTRWSVDLSIKGTDFKKKSQALANTFFGS